jgi:hypothetical protein
VPARHPLLVGWAGMIGMVLLLHFGSFALISLVWRRDGIDAMPLMNRPVSAKSLGDFWGRRWNTAFHQLAHGLAFRPLQRAIGPAGAVLGTFLLSGLVHDLIISVPARGGYGLPTAYFVIQGVGVLIERRFARGRLLTLLFTLGPLFLLFHPPFSHARDRAVPHGDPRHPFRRCPVTLQHLLLAAGVLHFTLLLPGALLPKVLQWREELRNVCDLSRHIIWVHGAFVTIVIVGFGALTLLNASALTSGTMLARSLCGLIALFWLARLGIQLFLFDARSYLKNWFLKTGYHTLTGVFTYFAAVYAWAALLPRI